MKAGQSVYVNRQIGKNGTSKRTKGTIESFSSTVVVNGKPTAKVKFSDDKNDWYWFPVDELELALQ